MKRSELIKYLPDYFRQQIDETKLTTTDNQAKETVFCPLHDDNTKSAVFYYQRGNLFCSACCENVELDELVKRLNDVDDLFILSALKKQPTNDNEDLDNWKKLSDDFCTKQFAYTDMFAKKIELKTCKELMIARRDSEYFSIPVIINGVIQDIRSYYPNQDPKYKSEFNAVSGLIIPYDIWKQTPIEEPTYICAGEKDMLVARSMGLNAICITGGEMAEPQLTKCFEGRECYILYDKDDTGRKGGVKLANFLVQKNAKVKNVVKFHEALDNKEDIYDFFVTHNKTVRDLQKYIFDTPYHKSSTKPLMPNLQLSLLEIHKDRDNRFTNQHYKTNIQCIETDTQQYSIPVKATLEPYGEYSNLPEIKWDYTLQTRPDKILKLFNNIDKHKDVEIALLKTLKASDKRYRVKVEEEKNFYCGVLRPLVERDEDRDYISIPEFDYISTIHLESSKLYEINYVVIKNDNKGRTTTIAVYDSQSLNDFEFEINETNKQLLANFHNDYTDPQQKVTELYNRACDENFLSPKLSREIWEFFELVFCSPLEYNYQKQPHRAAIHACAIGDSQIGKSWTLERMIKIYGQGKKLNAKTSTLTALVGGADKSSTGGYRIKAGELVFNHKGLVGIEEIHGNPDYYPKITEIKSSGKVQITRVAGSGNFACLLRLIEIANPRALTTVDMYDTCYDLIKELITQPEDIGRVDLFGIFSNQHFRNDVINPLASTMFETKAYQTRTHWIWSRKPEQIIMDFDEAILKKACEKLDKAFLLDVPIFGGVLTANRILRLACAYAGMLVSTDSTFQNLVVKNEHIKLATKYFLNTYASNNYKLDKASKQYCLKNEFVASDMETFKNLIKNEQFVLEQTVKLGTVHQSFVKDILGHDSVSLFYQQIDNYHWIIRNSYAIKPTKRLVLLVRALLKGGDEN